MSCSACGNNGDKANIMDPNLRYQADTMFAKRKTQIKKDMDTICMLQQDSLVAVYKDSLLRYYTEQMDAIIGK